MNFLTNLSTRKNPTVLVKNPTRENRRRRMVMSTISSSTTPAAVSASILPWEAYAAISTKPASTAHSCCMNTARTLWEVSLWLLSERYISSANTHGRMQHSVSFHVYLVSSI